MHYNQPETHYDESNVPHYVMLTNDTVQRPLWRYTPIETEGGDIQLKLLAIDSTGASFTVTRNYRYQKKLGQAPTLTKIDNTSASNDNSMNQISFDINVVGQEIQLQVTGMAKEVWWKARLNINSAIFSIIHDS